MIHTNLVPVKNFSRLEQNTQLRQGSTDTLEGLLVRAGEGVQVNALREI